MYDSIGQALIRASVSFNENKLTGTCYGYSTYSGNSTAYAVINIYGLKKA